LGTGGLFLRRLRARVSDRPTGFVWVEKGRLAGTGYPSSRGQVLWLVAQGVNSILTLTPEPLPRDFTEDLPLTLGHVPMKDHAPPDQPTLNAAVEFLHECLGEGKSVAVHCLAGQGRTGCVLAAFLISDRHLPAAEALRVLREIKPQFVEEAQEKSIFDYAGADSPSSSIRSSR
jgi:atypical dual specificity phosphatase